jgi:predicted O-methyltransferase YrrM
MLTSIKRVVKRRLAALVSDVVTDIVRRESSHQLFDISSERQRIALHNTARYVGHYMLHAEVLQDRPHLLTFALERTRPPGLYLEFGVASGTTVNLIASAIPSPIYGFDSFAGLPEAWFGYLPKGAFRQEQLPQVRENVELIVGLFAETLPRFLGEHPERVTFMHVDSDLYSSAKTIFEHLGPRIGSGTVIVFDEYFNYPGWEDGEYKAFKEFVVARGLSYTYLGYTNSQQVALRVD